jgi:hypothetical protein
VEEQHDMSEIARIVEQLTDLAVLPAVLDELEVLVGAPGGADGLEEGEHSTTALLTTLGDAC